jgi:hypothetical protein
MTDLPIGPVLSTADPAGDLMGSAVQLSTIRHMHPAGWCSAWTAGIEPATTGFGDQRSSWLSYVHMSDVNENRPPGVSLRAASSQRLQTYPEASRGIRVVRGSKDAGMLAYPSPCSRRLPDH